VAQSIPPSLRRKLPTLPAYPQQPAYSCTILSASPSNHGENQQSCQELYHDRKTLLGNQSTWPRSPTPQSLPCIALRSLHPKHCIALRCPAGEVVEAMGAARVPCGPILTVADILQEDQYKARSGSHGPRACAQTASRVDACSVMCGCMQRHVWMHAASRVDACSVTCGCMQRHVWMHAASRVDACSPTCRCMQRLMWMHAARHVWMHAARPAHTQHSTVQYSTHTDTM